MYWIPELLPGALERRDWIPVFNALATVSAEILSKYGSLSIFMEIKAVEM